MRAGKLNKKVTIEAPATATSQAGGTTTKWQPVAENIWAAIEPLRGREWFDAGGTHSEVDTRIRIRWRPGINSSMRVVYKERIFDIQHPAEIRSEKRELHLMCKEYGNDRIEGA